MKWIVLLLGISTLTSCKNEVIFSKKIEIEHSSWHDTQEMSFEFEIQDTSSFFEISLNIEHAVNYAFENVYLKIKTIYPNGKVIEEPLSLELAGKGGQWYGDCGTSNCIIKIILQEKTLFRPAGLYILKFKPYNRDSPINGIKSLRLSIHSLNI